MHDRCLLLFRQSLEVVRLDAVGRQHANLSLLILGHEIVGQSEVDFVGSISHLLSLLVIISVALLFGHLSVGVHNRVLHGLTLGIVVLLSFLQHLSEMGSLFLLLGRLELLL